jgi:tetratricopeptide (TPR) repeat protein
MGRIVESKVKSRHHLSDAGRQQVSMWMLFPVLLLCAAVQAGAQKPPAPAESPLMKQFRQALSVAERGDERQALAMTKSLLEQHPDFAPALKLQGMLLEDTGQNAAAAVSYQKAFKLAPNDADLLFKVGVYRLLAGETGEAIALLLHHLRLEPKDGDGFYYLSQAYHLTGHDDLALKAIRECLQFKPDKTSVWQKYGELLCSTGDSETGIVWLLKAEQANPKLDRIDLDLGIASLSNMDVQNAEKYSKEATRLHPNDFDALELQASVEVKLAEWQEAKAAYEGALALKGGDPDALIGLGHCELELKDYRNAIDTLNRLLEIDPTKMLAHFYLSRAYAGMGNAAEAQHQADLHHRMMEQISFAPSALGSTEDRAVWFEARKLLEERREDAALKLFKDSAKGTSATPGHPAFLVGALYLYMGDAANGLRNLHRALEIEPKVRGAHTYMGIFDLQQGKLDEAEKEFTAEISNDPNYQTAVAELGVVRYQQQRWAEAADQLSRSHTRTPALLLTLCDSYFHLGKVKDANLTAEIVAAYSRDDQEMMESLIDLLKRNGQAELAQRLTGAQKP